jgi:hypothetical protein
MRFVLGWLALLTLRATFLPACTPAGFDPDATVQNPVSTSPNGRFTVVMRDYPNLPDFGSGRASDAPPTEDEEPRNTVTVALYDTATRALLRTREVPFSFHDVRLTNSGRYLVRFRGLTRWCGSPPYTADPLLAIDDLDAGSTSNVTLGDVLVAYDIESIDQHGEGDRIVLDAAGDDGTLSLTIQAPYVEHERRTVRRRIDLTTGKLLEARTPIWPQPHVWFVADSNASQFKLVSHGESQERLQIVPSETLLAQVRLAVIPRFTDVALKARVRGTVGLEFVIGESGEILEILVTRPLPFGLGEAAEEAARQWVFARYFVDGKPVKYRGSVLFEFRDVDDTGWKDFTAKFPAAMIQMTGS